jgi:hypothetical protein
MRQNEQKQQDLIKVNPPNILNTGLLFHTDILSGQYLIYNLFRILRPLRKKYKLTINDLLLLNGVFIYHKVRGSVYSYTTMRSFIGYFSTNKFLFHHTRLIEYGFIVQSDVMKGKQYYRITEEGIRVISEMNDSYERCLYSFIDSNSISL